MPAGRPKKNPDDVLLKSAELIGWALGGIEREIGQTRETLAKLTAQAAKLRAHAGLAGAKPTGAAASAGSAVAGEADGAPAETSRKRRRRKMSPEARKRISEMMKKRWAERRKSR